MYTVICEVCLLLFYFYWHVKNEHTSPYYWTWVRFLSFRTILVDIDWYELFPVVCFATEGFWHVQLYCVLVFSKAYWTHVFLNGIENYSLYFLWTRLVIELIFFLVVYLVYTTLWLQFSVLHLEIYKGILKHIDWDFHSLLWTMVNLWNERI